MSRRGSPGGWGPHGLASRPHPADIRRHRVRVPSCPPFDSRRVWRRAGDVRNGPSLPNRTLEALDALALPTRTSLLIYRDNAERVLGLKKISEEDVEVVDP